MGFGAEDSVETISPDDQGLCVQPVSVGSCTPLIEEGKQKLVFARY